MHIYKKIKRRITFSVVVALICSLGVVLWRAQHANIHSHTVSGLPAASVASALVSVDAGEEPVLMAVDGVVQDRTGDQAVIHEGETVTFATPDKAHAGEINPLHQPWTPEMWEKYRNLGYASEELQAQYEAYSTTTLMALGEDGDVLALQVLGYRYADAGEVERAWKAFWQAAKYGSTGAFMQLPVYAETEMLLSQQRGDTVGARGHYLEAQAYYQAGVLRGDLFLSDLLERRREMEDHPPLTDDEKRAVEHRARQILAELSRQREQIGLAGFQLGP